MKKKIYQSPRIEVVEAEQSEVLCASTKSMFEDDLDGSGFFEL